MYKILQKQVLSDAIQLIIIKAPLVAAMALEAAHLQPRSGL